MTGYLKIVNNRVSVSGKVYEGDTKSEASERSFTLPVPIRLALVALRDRQETERQELGLPPVADSAHIVVNAARKPLTPEVYSDSFVRATIAAGLPRLVLHGARHVAASMLASLKVPVPVAMLILGQSEADVYLGYAHAQRDDVDGALSQISAALS